MRDLGAEPTVEWCWKPRFNNKTKLGRVSESTARNRQWVALEVLNTFVRLGADINPRELIGERVARPSTYVSTRPLTDEEDRIVRRRAESKLARSRIGMLVGLSGCGGTAKEIAALRVCDIDLDTQTVSFGGRSARVNPLDEWTVTMTRRFFANHNDGLVNGDEPLCLSDSIGEVRGAQSVAVRLGRLLQEAGLKGRPGVSARSIRLTTARRVLDVDGIEAAARFLGRRRWTTQQPRSDTAGSATMARGGFRDVFGGKPVVRVADVDKAREPVERTGERNVKGERPKVDDMEWVLLGLSSPLFWACVEYLVDHVATFPKVGRPREHTVADWVLFWRATEIRESLRRTDDMFVSAINWRRARAVVEQMGWTEPEWLLSEWQMNRFQFDRFGKRYIGEEQIKELSRLISSNAVADARTLGQFPDSGGSRPSLTPDRVVYGDGSELKTMFNPRRKRVDPHTGEITYSRHDPDAIPHHHHLWVEDHYTGEKVCKICDFNKHRKLRSDGADGAHIYEMVTLLTRTDLRQERIVLGVGLREQHETDANKFTDMLLDLKHDEPR